MAPQPEAGCATVWGSRISTLSHITCCLRGSSILNDIMPDIDVDYNYSYKDDVIAFEAESNGWDHFAKICTFTAMNAKGIVRDIARVAG